MGCFILLNNFELFFFKTDVYSVSLFVPGTTSLQVSITKVLLYGDQMSAGIGMLLMQDRTVI